MRRKGFTLVEVLLVVIIVGVLAAIVIPRVLYTKGEAQKNACKSNKSAINAQVELWNLNQDAWPSPDNGVASAGATDMGLSNSYFPDGVPVCPVDSSDYVISTATHHVTGHNH